jgi:hypothetical protein
MDFAERYRLATNRRDSLTKLRTAVDLGRDVNPRTAVDLRKAVDLGMAVNLHRDVNPRMDRPAP